MEKLLLEKLDLLLHGGDPSSDPRALLHTLASCRALISNPSSSEASARSVFTALSRFLRHERRPGLLGPAITLLGDTAVRHRALLPSAVAASRPLLGCGKRLAAEALSVLVSAAEVGGEGLCSVRLALGEDLVLSLASNRTVAVRSLLLKLLVLDIDRGGPESLALAQPMLVLRLFLGLTADLYPSVRSAALGGLSALFSNVLVEMEVSAMEGCYDVAVLLLRDVDTFVRMPAIRLVSELGGMLAATKEGRENCRCSDELFLLLCSFARDMDVKVRLEVFVALGKVKSVSEHILLQSLSKKVLRSDSRGKHLAKRNVEESGPSISWAAGVFVHGLEDDFPEVRRAATVSLGTLTMLSAKFADNAVNFLMDMLNDDATVQLETLRTLTQMAMHDNLNMQERHMDMFLGALANNSAPIRCAAREVIQLMKFSGMEMFRSSISELLMNLETYPEDEDDVLKVLFCIGKAHGALAASIRKEFIQEIESTCLGEVNLDRPRVVALLVLALLSTFPNENLSCDVPARIISYAIPLLGRISRSLKGLMSQDSLLAYLCKLSGLPHPGTGSDSKEAQMKESETALYEKLAISASQQILRIATKTWPMIKAQCIPEVLKTLRACREEMEMIAWDVNASSTACLVFALEYIQVIQLIAEIWEQMQPKDLHATTMKDLNLLLEKLETSLRTMRYCFPGLSKEEEICVLELALLGCLLRLAEVGTWEDTLVRNMQFMISRLELIHGETSELSDFVKDLKSLFLQGGMNDAFSCTRIRDLLECFPLEGIMFCGKFRHTKAELQVLSEDSELPLPFIPGLPVGITFNITLYNVSKDQRVWLRMAVGELVQYSFLNLSQFDSSDFERRYILNIPFFGTPKATFFLLKARICLECPFELVTQKRKGQCGPRCKIIFLCEEKDVYLADVDKIKLEDKGFA